MAVESGCCLSANVFALVSFLLLLLFYQKLAEIPSAKLFFVEVQMGDGCHDASTNESSSAAAARVIPERQKLLEFNLHVF